MSLGAIGGRAWRDATTVVLALSCLLLMTGCKEILDALEGGVETSPEAGAHDSGAPDARAPDARTEMPGDAGATGCPCPWTCDGARCAPPVWIAAGDHFTCAVRASGEVDCWGQNDLGQLGTGDRVDRARPAPVVGAKDVVSIEAGDDHACALRSDAAVICWGSNSHGQLGDPALGPRPFAARVPGLDRVAQIAAGGATTCARTVGGEVVCWGAGESGQLGRQGGDRSAPTPVSLPGAATDLDVGRAHACALVQPSREIHCWGANAEGQLGRGNTVPSAPPAPATLVPPVAFGVMTGDDHTCVTLDPRETQLPTVLCFGDNDHGQLGDGTTSDRADEPAVLTNVLAMSGDRTCVRATFGPVQCFGEGIGPTPVLVGGDAMRDGGHVVLGARHGCGIHVVGNPRCWGENTRGQLGDGTTKHAEAPVDVLPPTAR